VRDWVRLTGLEDPLVDAGRDPCLVDVALGQKPLFLGPLYGCCSLLLVPLCPFQFDPGCPVPCDLCYCSDVV
jgi:hypothetical protein